MEQRKFCVLMEMGTGKTKVLIDTLRCYTTKAN